MNVFLIQNSPLVDNHSTKCKRYIDMDDQICSILNHCLDYYIPTGNFYRHYQVFATHEKIEADEGNWRITIVQSECKTKLIYYVIEYIS